MAVGRIAGDAGRAAAGADAAAAGKARSDRPIFAGGRAAGSGTASASGFWASGFWASGFWPASTPEFTAQPGSGTATAAVFAGSFGARLAASSPDGAPASDFAAAIASHGSTEACTADRAGARVGVGRMTGAGSRAG